MKLNLVFCFLITAKLAALSGPTPATAQLIPDQTLGAENTLVAPNENIQGIPSDRIDGGAIRGANLFHSFREFNVDDGRGVYFTNPAAVENILTRVTGGKPSNILGRIGVLGNANLFLINPNGIVFGRNATLDVGGSFFASTASNIVLGNGLNFDAVNPQAAPLLTVNIPIGLQFRGTERDILNAGGKLKVQNGRILALIGGQNTAPGTAGVTILAAGELTAPDGRIELGGLAAAGTVELSANGLTFPDRTPRADVFMSDRASLNVSASGRGSIAIAARNLDIVSGSSLNAGVLTGFNLGDAVSGNISINSTDTVTIANNSRVETDVKSGGVGNTGSIEVRAGSLFVSDGAVMLSGVRKADAQNPAGQGNGGNIAIEARDRVSVTGNNTAIVANIGNGVAGRSGKIRITAESGSISLADGARLRAGTSGLGNAGQITLRAGGAVSLTGASRIEAEADSGAVGNGGNVTISARSLFLAGNSSVVTRASKAEEGRPAARGNAGNVSVSVREGVTLDRGFIFTTVGDEVLGNSGAIAIDARSLSLSNGSRLTTATSGGTPPQTSKAGQTIINVRDRLTITGINSADPNNQSGIFASVTEKAQGGLGGGIKIAARSVTVRNRGQITASSETFQPLQTAENLRNNAGSINIKADNIRLEERGRLEANTQAGERAEIKLNTSGLQLRRNSTITTNAENATGGNITVNAGSLAGVSNSDITANARDGAGGKIRISSQAIFGLRSQTRQQVDSLLKDDQIRVSDFSQRFLPTSDILAISQTDPALSGTVTVVTPDVDPTSGLVELPQNIVDPAALIAQNPCAKGRASEFTITGRGGLPINPSEALNEARVRVNLVEPANSGNTVQNLPSQNLPSSPQDIGERNQIIVPANGWIRNRKGELILVGDNPNITGTIRQRQVIPSCQVDLRE